MGGLRFGFCIFHCSSFFSLLLLSLSLSACNCVASSRTVGWYFIRLPSLFLHFGSRVAPILGSGTLVFAKDWFFFLGVLVFLFYTWYFYFSLVRMYLSCFYFWHFLRYRCCGFILLACVVAYCVFLIIVFVIFSFLLGGIG